MKKPKRFFHGNAVEDSEEGFNAFNPKTFPPPPPWRMFAGHQLPGNKGYRRDVPGMPAAQQEAGKGYICIQNSEEDRANALVEMVNAALVLRRPLLLTGDPGVGKSTVAHAVAFELGLGEVLSWPIGSQTTLQQGLYEYDALARLQDANLAGGKAPNIGDYITLGSLGTALAPTKSGRPRALIIDEIDKADPDLPNDLLTVLEQGEFAISELVRVKGREDLGEVEVTPWDARSDETDDKIKIRGGRVQCATFPFIVMTSNGAREFSDAFLRRCLRLEIEPPSPETLVAIVRRRLNSYAPEGKQASATLKTALDAFSNEDELLTHFLKLRDEKSEIMATSQLLEAMFLRGTGLSSEILETLVSGIPLTNMGKVPNKTN